MEKEHRQQLLRRRVELVGNLRQVEEITDILMANQILSESQTQLILSSPVTCDRIRCLLDEIVRCGPNAYACFVSSLESTNQSFLRDLMNLPVPVVQVQQSMGEPTPCSILQPDGEQVIDKTSFIIPPYPVASSPRGYILLVNMLKFPTLRQRNGSQNDVIALKQLFEELGYSIIVVEDVCSQKLRSTLREFVLMPKHADVDAGGLIVMSHGITGQIYAADGIPIRVEEICDAFSNKSAPYLAGKPKFILIQACRGENEDRGVRIPDHPKAITPNLTSTDSPMLTGKINWESLPYMSDCVIAYSTLPGFVALRDEEKGSIYVQILVSVFRKYASQLCILSLLAEVNRILVIERQHEEIKQIAQPANTLRRPFFLSTAHFHKL